jgi:hypothetical protein
MKILFGLFFFSTIVVNAQTTYKKMTLVEGSENEITISLTKEKAYLSLIPLENIVKDVGLSFANYELPRFRKDLTKAIDKFKEWEQVAKDNHITDFKKVVKIEDDFGYDAHFYYGSSWYFDKNKKLEYTFCVKKNSQNTVTYFMKVTVAKMSSSTNQFIKCKGGIAVFFEVETMERFLSYFSDENLKQFRSSESATDDLFKDGEPNEEPSNQSLFKD